MLSREFIKEARIAIVVVLIEFFSWLWVTLRFCNSPFNEVLHLIWFMLAFPAICLIAHLIFYRLVPHKKPYRREIARYAYYFVFLFTTVGYLLLFTFLITQPNK